MGFLDKLKDVAKGAADKVAEMQAEKEKSAEIKALQDCGTIKGNGIPEGAEYCLDDKNNRVVIRTKFTEGNKYICEYSYDDVAELKLTESHESNYGTFRSYNNKFKLILNSGEELEISRIAFVYDEKDESRERREKKDRDLSHDLALAFMLKINDAETKEWVNSLYTSEELYPVFDESGEFLVGNLEENTAIILKR